MAKILMVIANNGFQDYEFEIPFDIFNEANLDVVVAA
jgi:putative intracellular protease/amidase